MSAQLFVASCFVVEATMRAQRVLTCMAPGKPCFATGSCHTGRAVLDDQEIAGYGPSGFPAYVPGPDPDDERWPASCGCGYAFGPNDDRRLFQDRLYRNPETGTLYTSATIPPGALWAAPWLFWKGPDEQCLLLQTPGGPWIADAPQEGLPITRSGFPPLVTVDGPIIAGAFHGELRDGVLIGALTSESESY